MSKTGRRRPLALPPGPLHALPTRRLRRLPCRRALALLLLPLCMLAACGGPTPSEVTVLEGSLEPLRGDFNADAGKVRAIFLASPT